MNFRITRIQKTISASATENVLKIFTHTCKSSIVLYVVFIYSAYSQNLNFTSVHNMGLIKYIKDI